MWEMCEKCTGNASASNIFSTVLFTADYEGLTMKATDIKTGITCHAEGVEVLAPGSIAIPTKRVGDLFRKADDKFTLEEKNGNIVMTSGRSRFRFVAYSEKDFPRLPSSKDAEPFCAVKAAELSKAMRTGILCASAKDEYPQYLSALYMALKNGGLECASTDKRRIAIAKATAEEMPEKEKNALLPVKAVNYFVNVLNKLNNADTPVTIKDDAVQVFFAMPGIEFSIRKLESKFPVYEKIIPTTYRTRLAFGADELKAALERIDIVVRDYNRTVIFDISGKDCECWGRSQEFGEAREIITPAAISGEVPLKAGFNVRFVTSALEALDANCVSFEFNGGDGHLAVRSIEKPDEFLALIAPVELSSEEISGETKVAEEENELQRL
jgi:DNA polymerase-3 subunit beta